MLPETCSPTLALGVPGSERRPAAALRCLSTGYLTADGRCECFIPHHVVTAAWRRALIAGCAGGEGFFRFTYNGGQWLGYGHPDGHVPGVYCPEHAAGRDLRAAGAIARADAPAPSLRPAARSPQPVA